MFFRYSKRYTQQSHVFLRQVLILAKQPANGIIDSSNDGASGFVQEISAASGHEDASMPILRGPRKPTKRCKITGSSVLGKQPRALMPSAAAGAAPVHEQEEQKLAASPALPSGGAADGIAQSSGLSSAPLPLVAPTLADSAQAIRAMFVFSAPQRYQ